MKKILAFAMATAMVLSLAACGNNNGADSSKGNVSSGSQNSTSGSQEPSSSGSGNYGTFTTIEEGKLLMATMPPSLPMR